MSGPVVAITTWGLTLLALGGCTSSPPQLGADPLDKARAAVQRLGGNPDELYKQQVMVKSMGSKDYSSKIIYLVPAKNGTDFTIVDEQGSVYRNYDDFVLRGTLTQ
jgi:hypothetical protein